MNISALYQNYSQRAADSVQSSETNAFVAAALRFVIQNVFVNIAATFVITTSTCTTKLDQWYSDISAKLFKTWGFMPVQLITVHDGEVPVRVPGRRFCNMLFIDSYHALINADIASHNQNFDNSEYYFIFLQTDDVLIPAEMQLILNYCLRNYWIHCNVMVQTAKVEILVYTYFPYTKNRCQQAVPVLVNSFNGERMVSAPMFPDKLTNMNHCPLALMTWHVPPFMNVQILDGALKMSGFEMQLVDALQARMNFTITVKLPQMTVREFKGTFFSARAAMKMLVDREVDFSVGYFRKTNERDLLASSTFTHYYAKQVLTVIRNNHKYTSLEVLAFPFRPHIWLIISACLALLFLLTVVSKHFWLNWLNLSISEPTLTQLKIIEMFMGLPTLRMPQCTSLRCFNMSWILGAFVLRAVYQSLLFHLIRTDLYRDAPISVESLITANYRAVITAHTLIILQYIPQIVDKRLQYIALNSTFEEDVFLYLERHIEEDLAAINAQDFVLAYGALKASSTDFQTLPEQFNVQQITMYLPKHSYLTDKFNQNILLFESFGLIRAWHRWSIDFKYASDMRQHSSMTIGQKELLGIYLITFGLLSLSAVVFLLELISKKVTI